MYHLVKKFFKYLESLSPYSRKALAAILGDNKTLAYGYSVEMNIAGETVPGWLQAFVNAPDPEKGKEICFEMLIADFLWEVEK